MFYSRKLKEQILELKKSLGMSNAFYDAIRSSLPLIEFSPEGIVIEVNDNFLDIFGYSRQEAIGQHHRVFCDNQYTKTSDYEQFWRNLHLGEKTSGTFQRIDKFGNTVWLEATYSPIEVNGSIERIVKTALDVTENTRNRMKNKAMLVALDRSLATIQFSPDGQIQDANQNFLDAVGYSLGEIVGKHHRLLCDEFFLQDQPSFWLDLGRGLAKAGQFKRITKSGDPIWLEATYNPVLDAAGNVDSVIKFASDITNKTTARDNLIEAAGYAKKESLTAEATIADGVSSMQGVVEINKTITQELAESSNSVENLHDQTDKIRDIVTTIGQVADQTNLLALNAAIEAARAGEQGRGFAVVADEVRSLAARTSSSTVEISAVVQNNVEMTAKAMESMERVKQMAQEGEKLTDETFGMLEGIRTSTSEVAQILAVSHDRIKKQNF